MDDRTAALACLVVDTEPWIRCTFDETIGDVWFAVIGAID